jgi:hypothetical protein
MRRYYLMLCFFIVWGMGLRAATPVASASFSGGEQGRIVIQAKINGKGPYPFVFDTGSINVISLDLANTLGIPVSGKQQISAFGGSLETASATVDSITVGDFKTSDTITMPHTNVTVIGGGPFTNGGPVGFLGWEFLTKVVVEIDYEHNQLNFYDPAKYTYEGSGARLPVTISGNFILIPARIDGNSATLELDSGNENSALVLFRRFIKKTGLHSDIEAVTGYGFGGLTRAMITHIRSLEMGGYKVESALTNLSVDETGVEAADLDGNVGAPILREFTWVYDIPHQAVFLEPNKWFRKPELDDHSGVVLDSRGGAAKVLFVYPNSPAEHAAIKVGDELMGSDGQALTSDEWHDLLDAAPGTVVSVRVTHAGKSRTVALTLSNYF